MVCQSGCWRAAGLVLLLAALGRMVLADEASQSVRSDSSEDRPAVRKPLGPDELPESLPGRWRVSLCALEDKHAWIHFENVDSGEVRTISRFHLLVGGYRNKDEGGWHYPPTFRTGLYMDREQRIEAQRPSDDWQLLTVVVDDPVIFKGKSGDARGHGLVVNNCATYARDAWHFYTGDHYWLDRLHSPDDLRAAVLRAHPELRAAKSSDEPAPPAAKEERPAVRGSEKRTGLWNRLR